MSSPNLLYDAIAIDGPAASGKSTVARLLAERLNLIMVNSGEMYRAVTLAVMQHGVNPCDPIPRSCWTGNIPEARFDLTT